jgi:hypothetical protein
VGDIAASFEDKGFKAFFAEFFGCPAAADTRADNDGVKRIIAHEVKKLNGLRINIANSRYFELT